MYGNIIILPGATSPMSAMEFWWWTEMCTGKEEMIFLMCYIEWLINDTKLLLHYFHTHTQVRGRDKSTGIVPNSAQVTYYRILEWVKAEDHQHGLQPSCKKSPELQGPQM